MRMQFSSQVGLKEIFRESTAILSYTIEHSSNEEAILQAYMDLGALAFCYRFLDCGLTEKQATITRGVVSKLGFKRDFNKFYS